jgi:hypothetical protein
MLLLAQPAELLQLISCHRNIIQAALHAVGEFANNEEAPMAVRLLLKLIERP